MNFKQEINEDNDVVQTMNRLSNMNLIKYEAHKSKTLDRKMLYNKKRRYLQKCEDTPFMYEDKSLNIQKLIGTFWHT